MEQLAPRLADELPGARKQKLALLGGMESVESLLEPLEVRRAHRNLQRNAVPAQPSEAIRPRRPQVLSVGISVTKGTEIGVTVGSSGAGVAGSSDAAKGKFVPEAKA